MELNPSVDSYRGVLARIRDELRAIRDLLK
jgi:hypothetical protein